jgi:hypothetical protein
MHGVSPHLGSYLVHYIADLNKVTKLIISWSALGLVADTTITIALVIYLVRVEISILHTNSF